MVPLTMPTTRLIRSPASDCVSGRITGIAPATAASKYRSHGGVSAASASSPVSSASSALLAVTTDLPGVERRQQQRRGAVDAADHLDDDVDVVAGDQRLRVGGEQLRRERPGRSRAAHRDAAQFQRGADAGREVVGLLRRSRTTSAPTLPGPSTATPMARCPGASVSSRWSLRNLQAEQIFDGLPPQQDTRDCRPRTATTAGRGSRL